MPARSHKQRRFLHAKFGHKWVVAHHFDKVKPKKSKKKSARKKRK